MTGSGARGSWFRRVFRANSLFGVYILCILFTYYFLHGIYRLDNTDDAWTMSFIYNFWKNGVMTDKTFGDASGLPHYFGMTQAVLYGEILDITNWTKNGGHLISTFFMVISTAGWYFIVLQLGYEKQMARAFALLMLFTEAFFGAANQARPDSMTFCIASLSLLSGINRQWILAGALAVVAIENHPMGAVAMIYALCYILNKRRILFAGRRMLLSIIQRYAFGCLLGLVYYLALHHSDQPLLGAILKSKATGVGTNLLYNYFFLTKYQRHLPELAIIIAAAAIYLRNKHYRDDSFSGLFAGVMLFVTFLIPRANFHYMVYIYPALLLLIVSTAQRMNRLNLLMLVFLLLLIPQYGMVYRQNHGYRFDDYIQTVSVAVPPDGLPVMGGPNDWFAFQERQFYCYYEPDYCQRLKLPMFYLIEGDEYQQSAQYREMRGFVADNYDSLSIKPFNYHGRNYRVVRLEVRPGATKDWSDGS